MREASLAPSQVWGSARAIRARGYQCGPKAGPAFQVAMAPAVASAMPIAQPTRACPNGRLGARYAVRALPAMPQSVR